MSPKIVENIVIEETLTKRTMRKTKTILNIKKHPQSQRAILDICDL